VAIPEEQKSEEQKEGERVSKVEKMREWQAVLREAFPMEVTRFEVKNARVRYVDRTMQPHPEVTMEQVGIVATGLRNRRETNEEYPAKLMFNGLIKTGGRVAVEAQVDPIADQPTFRTTMRVEGLELVPLRDFVRAYAQVDVESGRFTVFVDTTAQGGGYRGYLRPFFQDLSFKAVQEEKNVIKRAATAVASKVSSVLKNEEEKVATEVPIEGNFTDNKADIWATIRNLLRNAFVESLREGFARQNPSD
jgi:hypothetical protein